MNHPEGLIRNMTTAQKMINQIQSRSLQAFNQVKTISRELPAKEYNKKLFETLGEIRKEEDYQLTFGERPNKGILTWDEDGFVDGHKKEPQVTHSMIDFS